MKKQDVLHFRILPAGCTCAKSRDAITNANSSPNAENFRVAIMYAWLGNAVNWAYCNQLLRNGFISTSITAIPSACFLHFCSFLHALTLSTPESIAAISQWGVLLLFMEMERVRDRDSPSKSMFMFIFTRLSCSMYYACYTSTWKHFFCNPSCICDYYYTNALLKEQKCTDLIMHAKLLSLSLFCWFFLAKRRPSA